MRIRTLAAVCVPALLLACQPAALTDAQRVAIEGEIEQLYADQAAILNAVDVEGWLAQFEDSEDFTIAVNGEVSVGFAAMAEELRSYWQYESAEFAWGDDHYIQVLAPDIACVTSTYEWHATTTAGETEDARGTWTVVLRKRDGVWKIVMVAQTFPPPETTTTPETT
ncbi:MAG: nuclear transport factor 2 family protein [Gemmatimonadota bacterium]|nr:MAG: nuclear transport factor 2 family protein [Gemmatimonadota bacterium]